MTDKPSLGKSDADQIPDVVIQRLPLYSRALGLLALERAEITNSFELGRRLGITSAQIRKDLSYFGKFGKRGTGYNVKYLLARLKEILGLDKEWPMALVGVGRLGQAIARNPGDEAEGFRIAVIFDTDPQKLGKKVEGLVTRPVADMASVLPAQAVKIGILAVPASQAQRVTEMLVESGVEAILNYAPISIQVPAGIIVRSIDPVLVLQSMTYYLNG